MANASRTLLYFFFKKLAQKDLWWLILIIHNILNNVVPLIWHIIWENASSWYKFFSQKKKCYIALIVVLSVFIMFFGV